MYINPDTNEATNRREALITDLDKEIGLEKSRAKWNNVTSFFFLLLAILASTLAGILGLAEVISARAVGIIALLPTMLVLLERSFKFDQRGRWHQRKKNRLADLKDQLIYQQPIGATLDQVAAINKKKHQLNYQMQEEWDTGLSLNWATVDSQQTPTSKQPPALPEKK